MDFNSIMNQNIKTLFVEREVYSCVTSMVEYILKKSYEDNDTPFNYDDISNQYLDHSDEIEELQEKLENYENQVFSLEEKISIYEPFAKDVSQDLAYKEILQLDIQTKINEKQELQDKISEIEDKIKELQEEQEEPQEVYEWWLVSPFLCEKLKEKGEVVIEDENIWGRGCTGQAILLDWVISQICSDMEILEGQKYEMKK